MKLYLSGLLMALVILSFPFPTALAQSQETDRTLKIVGEAFKVLEDGTKFYKTNFYPIAIASDGTIYKLSSDETIMRDTVLGKAKTTTKQSILNKYTSGRFSKFTNSSPNTSKTTEIKPYSFRNQIRSSTARSNANNKNRFSGSRYNSSNKNAGYSLSMSSDQILDKRDRLRAQAMKERTQ